MKKLAFILFLGSAFSCAKQEDKTIMVNSVGALREIMHQGQFQTRVSLDTLIKKGTYGLGAMSKLSGEVLVLDGKIYASYVQDEDLVIGEVEELKATLFVYSQVELWDTIQVEGTDDLDALLVQKASQLGISEPFPFQLLGTPELDYHVINFDPVNGDFNKHKEGAFKGNLLSQDVTILGFYATNAKGIYTHHDSNLHMHVITSDRSIMGHVDKLRMNGQSFQLLLPGEVRK